MSSDYLRQTEKHKKNIEPIMLITCFNKGIIVIYF